MENITIIIITLCVAVFISEYSSVRYYVSDTLDIDTTTTIKGIAIISIILSHISGNMGIRYFTPFGGIGVALFLFLSGYGLNETYKKKQLASYWSKRFIAIYPPYFLTNVFVILFSNITNLCTIFLCIILIKPLIPYGWFFVYLLLWYLMFWFSRFFIKGKFFNLILLSTSLFSYIALPEIMAEQSFSFVLGVYASTFSEKALTIKKLEKKSLFFRGGLFIFTGIIFLVIKQFDVVREMPQLFFNFVQIMVKLPIAIGIIILVFACSRILKYVLFFKVGNISYEMFLIHGLFINRLPLISVTDVFCAIALSLICSVLLYIINNYISRYLKVLLVAL